MPVYDYDCAACGRRFEVIHGVHAEGPTTCQLCGKGPVRKAVTAAAVHYRGSGWAKKERRSAATTKPSTDTSTDGAGSDAPAADHDAPARDADAPAKKTDAPAKTGEAPRKRGADTPAAASSKQTD